MYNAELKEEYENLELKNQAIAEKIAEENLEISEIPDIRSDHFPSPVLNQKLPDCLEHAGGFILRAADTAGDENLPREPLPGSAPPQKISVPLSGGTVIPLSPPSWTEIPSMKGRRSPAR